MKPSLFPALIVVISALGLVSRGFAAEPPTDVILLGHDDVAKKFEKGGAFLSNSLYKVMAGRRDKPGVVEIHTYDTDVFYILEGSATFVTGGTAVDPKDIGPGEIHATSITGGTPRHLEKGDVIVIPNGTPHQFTEVNGPFLYFVVKASKSH